jgi:hypothetical protein
MKALHLKSAAKQREQQDEKVTRVVQSAPP